MLALNIFNDATLFNSVGIISQIFVPRYRRNSSPKEVVRILVLKMLFDEYNNASLGGGGGVSHYSRDEAINNLVQFDCQSLDVSNMNANRLISRK